jgi:hypothetical protein
MSKFQIIQGLRMTMMAGVGFGLGFLFTNMTFVDVKSFTPPPVHVAEVSASAVELPPGESPRVSIGRQDLELGTMTTRKLIAVDEVPMVKRRPSD